jgi:hypothetical protein
MICPTGAETVPGKEFDGPGTMYEGGAGMTVDGIEGFTDDGNEPGGGPYVGTPDAPMAGDPMVGDDPKVGGNIAAGSFCR